VRIGGFSYSLYLIHIPVVAALRHGLMQLPAYAGLSYLQGFCVLALAWGFARVFERRPGRPAGRA